MNKSISVQHKYRKKPIVIEAFQFFRDHYWSFEPPNSDDWPVWAQRACGIKTGEQGAIWMDVHTSSPTYEQFFCGTLEGKHEVSEGDYIIQGIKGEIYPCKPDIFEATYEAVSG